MGEKQGSLLHPLLCPKGPSGSHPREVPDTLSHTCVRARTHTHTHTHTARGLTRGPSCRPRWQRWSRTTAQRGWRRMSSSWSCSRKWHACAAPRCRRSAPWRRGSGPTGSGCVAWRSRYSGLVGSGPSPGGGSISRTPHSGGCARTEVWSWGKGEEEEEEEGARERKK